MEEDDIELLKKQFNFGAFAFGFIWGVANGVFLKTLLFNLLVLAFLFIPYIGWLPAIAVCVYIGFKGNAWALENKKDLIDFNQFETRILKWDIAAIIYFMIIVLVLFTVAGIWIHKGYKHYKEEYDFKPEINSSGSYWIIKFIAARPALINADNPEALVNYFVNNESLDFLKTASIYKYEPNSIILDVDERFTHPGKDYLPKEYENGKVVYKFEKSKECLRKKKNCSITYYIQKDCNLIPITKTFYNTKGGRDEVSYYQDDTKSYKYVYTLPNCK